MSTIKGMTGYGSAEMSTGNIKAVVEIKSLNHRYLDTSFYLPIGFGSLEDKIRQIVQKQLQRGRVTISIKLTQKPGSEVTLNRDAVKKHLKYANSLKKEFKIKNDLSLSDIVRLPGVLEVKETMVLPDKLWPNMEKSLRKALTGLISMREREGRSLAKDIKDKLRKMNLQVKKIQARATAILKTQKKILTDEEFKSFQKSNDVNEEISRLTHYIDELGKLLAGASAVGKKMDFIAQEMQRETNTIGSKLQDKVVSNAVIALKSKVENIREQAQNIE